MKILGVYFLYSSLTLYTPPPSIVVNEMSGLPVWLMLPLLFAMNPEAYKLLDSKASCGNEKANAQSLRLPSGKKYAGFAR